LQEAGIVLHQARSGRLILKAAAQVRDGSILVDEEGRRTCKVIETIGPVASPYLSTQPLTDRLERIKGQKLFLSDLSEYGERRSKRYSSNKKKFDKRDSRNRR